MPGNSISQSEDYSSADIEAIKRIQRQFHRVKLRKACANSCTPNQAYLLSNRPVTAAAALAYLKGPSVKCDRKLVYYPDYKTHSSAYNTLIYNQIDPTFHAQLAPRYEADSSRRCFDSVLAYKALSEQAQFPALIPILERIYADFKSKNPDQELLGNIERGESISSDVNQTYLDFSNAIKVAQHKFSSDPLFQRFLKLLLMIWVSSMHSNPFVEVYNTEVEPPLKKGRLPRDSFPSSNRLGTFKHDDFLPDFLKPHFLLPQPIIRGADFSTPISALKQGSGFFQPQYANTLLCQGGISGLVLALLGRLQNIPADLLMQLSRSNLAKEIMLYLLCALVFMVGGHSFIEMITAINLPAVLAQIQDASTTPVAFRNFYLKICGDQLYEAFTPQLLQQALAVTKRYEIERRRAMA